MTITATVPKIPYTASGSATVFPYPFKIFDASELIVLVNGIPTSTGFTVDGIGSATGGNVTFAVAPIAGTSIVLYSKTTLSQATDWSPNDPDPAESKENAFDKVTKIAQEHDEAISRSLRVSIIESLNMTLPSLAARANKVLGFDSSGLPTNVALPGAAGGDLSLATAIATGSITARSFATRFSEWKDAYDYQAVGDGVADDFTPLNNARAAATAPTNGGVLFLAPGTYKVGTNLSFDSDITIIFSQGARLAPSTGITVTINGPIIAPLSQIFAGAGTVTFAGVRSPSIAYPQWWGATGDGATDDSASFIATEAAIRNRGTGRIHAPAGTYMVTLSAHPVAANFWCGFSLGHTVKLSGDGRDATIIKLIANQTRGRDLGDDAHVIINRNPLTGTNENIDIRDLTIDGNGANQTHTINGLSLYNTRGCLAVNVRVKNCRGTVASETFLFENQSIDTQYIYCEAIGDAGSTASGFSADYATNIQWIGCVARGMTTWMGFTHFGSRNLTYTGCVAYSNGLYGFNSEESQNVEYVNCLSGCKTANANPTTGWVQWPFAANTALGNNIGFKSSGTNSARYVNCVARNNTTYGMAIESGSATYGASSGEIIGGSFDDNTQFGFRFNSLATVPNWRITGLRTPTGNGTAGISINTLGNETLPGIITNPVAVPATTVAQTNIYPFDVDIYIRGGTGTVVNIDGGVANSVLVGTYHLRPGQTITLTYTVAPSWTWYAV